MDIFPWMEGKKGAKDRIFNITQDGTTPRAPRDIHEEVIQIQARMKALGHERLFFFSAHQVRARIIIAIHNRVAGPGLGGCRMWNYDTFDEMVEDALLLSCAMTRKATLANIKVGGGKMVVWGDPYDATFKTPALLAAIGRAMNAVNAKGLVYITGEDAGMNVPDMDEISRHVKNARSIGGRSDTYRDGDHLGGGDSSYITALGIIHGMEAALRFIGEWGGLKNKIIAIQGLGNVGRSLALTLLEEHPNIKIFASELRMTTQLELALSNTSITLVPPEEIYEIECDIFSPCALGVTLNSETIPQLRCKIVAGAQNNQLASPEDGMLLHELGILYVPHYVINAGGIINIADEVLGTYDRNRVLLKISYIRETVWEVLDQARRENRPTQEVADEMAAERLALLPIGG